MYRVFGNNLFLFFWGRPALIALPKKWLNKKILIDKKTFWLLKSWQIFLFGSGRNWLKKDLIRIKECWLKIKDFDCKVFYLIGNPLFWVRAGFNWKKSLIRKKNVDWLIWVWPDLIRRAKRAGFWGLGYPFCENHWKFLRKINVFGARSAPFLGFEYPFWWKSHGFLIVKSFFWLESLYLGPAGFDCEKDSIRKKNSD